MGETATEQTKPKLTLCRASVNLSGVGKVGTPVWVDMEDLQENTLWVERGILVPEPDANATPPEDAYEVPEQPDTPEPAPHEHLTEQGQEHLVEQPAAEPAPAEPAESE